MLFQNLCTMAAGFAIAYSASWRMALVITACLPILGLAGFFQVGRGATGRQQPRGTVPPA